MAENRIHTHKLKFFVKEKAGKLISDTFPDWYNEVPFGTRFGISAEILRQLMTTESSEFTLMEKKRTLISEIWPISISNIRHGKFRE